MGDKTKKVFQVKFNVIAEDGTLVDTDIVIVSNAQDITDAINLVKQGANGNERIEVYSAREA